MLHKPAAPLVWLVITIPRLLVPVLLVPASRTLMIELRAHWTPTSRQPWPSTHPHIESQELELAFDRNHESSRPWCGLGHTSCSHQARSLTSETTLPLAVSATQSTTTRNNPPRAGRSRYPNPGYAGNITNLHHRHRHHRRDRQYWDLERSTLDSCFIVLFWC